MCAEMYICNKLIIKLYIQEKSYNFQKAVFQNCVCRNILEVTVHISVLLLNCYSFDVFQVLNEILIIIYR